MSLLLAALLVLSLIPIASASAFNYVGATSSTGCTAANRQDNSKMTYYRKNLTPKMSGAVAWILANTVDPTAVFVKSEQSSETNKTDVVYREWGYSGYCNYTWHAPGGTSGVVGLAECKSLSGDRCQKFEVRFDTSYTNLTTTTITKARKLACHETGHTLGMIHTVNGTTCMKQGSSILQTGFSSHEINAVINANY